MSTDQYPQGADAQHLHNDVGARDSDAEFLAFQPTHRRGRWVREVYQFAAWYRNQADDPWSPWKRRRWREWSAEYRLMLGPPTGAVVVHFDPTGRWP